LVAAGHKALAPKRGKEGIVEFCRRSVCSVWSHLGRGGQAGRETPGRSRVAQ
jgi:hypothetical protein